MHCLYANAVVQPSVQHYSCNMAWKILTFKIQDGRLRHIEDHLKLYLLNQMWQKSKWNNFFY